jgi:hypothetical protein
MLVLQDFSFVPMSGHSRVQTQREISRVKQSSSTADARQIFDSPKNFYYQRRHKQILFENQTGYIAWFYG